MPPDEGVALSGAAGGGVRARPVSRGRQLLRKVVDLPWRHRQASDRVLFALDHHRGSEENQAGWEHHEPDLVDADIGKMDTLPIFRRTVHDAGLEARSSPWSVIHRRSAPCGTSPCSALHRRWPWPRARPPRLRDLGAAREGRRHLVDPRRLPGPCRRRSAPTRSTCGDGVGGVREVDVTGSLRRLERIADGV